MIGRYVPLFDTITTGTLYGRWPDIGLWPIVLALSDRFGRLDVTPQYIAGVTGLPVHDVIACMQRFCAPDPYSRTKAENGARLKLIDAYRDWGWIVVNHGRYAERARLRNKDELRKLNSPVSPDSPRNTPNSTDNTLSSSSVPASATTDGEGIATTRTPPTKTKARKSSKVPADFQPDLTLAISEIPDIDAEREVQKFRDWEFKTPRSDWAAAWRNWIGMAKETGKYSRKTEDHIAWR